IACATTLEANVRELRMIAEHSPRYNRRAKFPERMPWLRLIDEAHPRLAIVTAIHEHSQAEAYIGPFPSRQAARAALEALHASLPNRQSTHRLPVVANADARACQHLNMGRCVAPCTAGADDAGLKIREQYGVDVRAGRHAMTRDPSPVVEHFENKMAAL